MSLRKALSVIAGVLREVPSGDYLDPATLGSGASATKFLRGDSQYATANAGNTLRYSNTSVPGGNTVANTTTETAFTSSSTLDHTLFAVGTVVRFRAFGVYSTTTVAPTLRLKLKLGSTVILDTGAISALLGSVANLGWLFEGEFVINTIGASGTIEAQGYAEFSTMSSGGISVNSVNTATITIDNTADLVATLTTQFGTANASNSITLRTMVFEVLNTEISNNAVLDTDNALTSNSDTLVPSQKAIKYYVDNKPRIASITVETPTASEDLSIFFTDVAVVITKLVITLVGSASPSVTVDIRHGTDLSAAGTALITSPSATTNTTTGNSITSFNNASVSAGSHVRLKTTAQSGTVTKMNVSIFFH